MTSTHSEASRGACTAAAILTVVLQETLTKGERSLVGDGVVIAFMSDNHIDPDVAAEVFPLAPLDAGPQGDGARGAATTPGEAVAGA